MSQHGNGRANRNALSSLQQFIRPVNSMKFLRRNITNENQWQNYKQLELIPSFVANPHTNKFSLIGLNLAWQLLIKALTDELVDEQQVEYLERCWQLNDLEEKGNAHANTLDRLLYSTLHFARKHLNETEDSNL